jgi:hypothetical protein
VVLSHDTSGCSCVFVALPPPSVAVLSWWCVWTPVMRAAVYLLYVSVVERRVAVLHVCHSRHSLAVCRCCGVVVVVRRALVCTCMLSLLSCLWLARASQCQWLAWSDDGVRYLWGCLVMSLLGSLAHGVVRER